MSVAERVIERIEVAGGILTVCGNRIRCRLPEDAAHLLNDLKTHKSEVIACLNKRGIPPTTETTKAPSAPKMPPGVTLIEWNPKPPPVGISYCAVVNDVEGFITDTLTQLGKLLDSKAEPDRARKLRDLVDALEQCGVVVQVRLWS